MHRYCLALDLINDEQLIKEYEVYHRQVWPEILQSIREAGIDDGAGFGNYRVRSGLDEPADRAAGFGGGLAFAEGGGDFEALVVIAEDDVAG